MTPPISKPIGLALALATLLSIASRASAVMVVGNPYAPSPGDNFKIFALQGIDASSPQGKTGFSPQVNRDFEFPDSIGVSYDKGGGQLTNFGLGLYNNAQGQVQSTGLKIQYNGLVDASMVNITVEDFDIQAGKATFFNPQKVEPNILLLGPGNTVFASATPKDIFPALVATGTSKGDVWNINFGDLLNSLQVANGQISGFILSADMLNGERPNSDPYLLVSVGNGCMVPEPANYAVGLAGILFGGLFQLRQLRARRKSAVVPVAQ
jgi:hypothetical protein